MIVRPAARQAACNERRRRFALRIPWIVRYLTDDGTSIKIFGS